MSKYSNFSRTLKQELTSFLNLTIFHFASRPQSKFILDMLYGILKSGTIVISEIARSCLSNNSLNVTEVRLINALKNNDLSKFQEHLIAYSRKHLLKQPFEIEIDGTDVTKPYGKHFEDLYFVHDGSKEGRPKEKGYYVDGIIAIGYNNTVVPLVLHALSSVQVQFKSTNTSTIDDLNSCVNCSDAEDEIILTFDRGYDSSVFINFVTEIKKYYVIRAKNQRKYWVKHKYLTIEQASKLFKGKYASMFKTEGKTIEVKYSAVRISHKDFNAPAWLVLESFSNENTKRVYITNVDCSTKAGCITVLKAYRKRWRIEEYFRFIKQEFKMENFRVRSLAEINNLLFLINLATTFITSIIVKKSNLYYACLECYKAFSDKENEENLSLKYGESGLMLYRIKRGLQEILSHSIEKPQVPGRDRTKKNQEPPLLRIINNFSPKGK